MDASLGAINLTVAVSGSAKPVVRLEVSHLEDGGVYECRMSPDEARIMAANLSQLASQAEMASAVWRVMDSMDCGGEAVAAFLDRIVDEMEKAE